MKGGGGGTARLGGQIHEDQIGDPGPVDEMRKVQNSSPRFLPTGPVHRHHRKRVEDAPGGIDLHGDGGEPSPAEERRSAPTPVKSDVSVVRGYAWSIIQDVCPLASREILTKSSQHDASRSSIRQRASYRFLAQVVDRNAAVLIPPSWRRTGKRASPTGGLAPTTASPMAGRL